MTTNAIDSELKHRFPHWQQYPNYLPYVGTRYGENANRILIIAESHYLPKEFNHKIKANDWYLNPEKTFQLFEELKAKVNPLSWIHTRKVVKHYIENKPKSGGLSIFHKLEEAYKEVYKGTSLLEHCLYMNYFQRPSEVSGDSIVVHPIDNEYALKALLAVNEVLKPNKIIFVSSKAYDTFKKSVSKEQLESFDYVGSVPHPSASSWWHRTSTKYGTKEIPTATGREKFMRIIKPRLRVTSANGEV